MVAHHRTVKDMFTNPFVFPPEDVPILPLSFSHTMLVLVMSHVIFRLHIPERNSRAITTYKCQPLHRHRLEAIRALNQEVADQKTRFSDATFFSISVLTSVEVREPFTSTSYLGVPF